MYKRQIFERVRRIELQLDVPPSHYEPGATPTTQKATTGAAAGPKPPSERGEQQKTTGAQSGPATGKPDDREAVKL